MRVKRLEIQGFKSFKDKTVISFDKGITGIVGPNGCGKSNIVDAFFWVMGEQSYKHMRGTGSEDLIFNGSSKYAPLGMAEATLVLETGFTDTESAPAGATSKDLPLHLRSKEISVTRRVYRTGEGEYFINGVQARLKDIQELFMDTGVGAKGYSVIEQGQIGKIVNAKPEERRLLIEEAAGIAKYKARKKESLRKMEATQANLARLNDIIQEIERNLASLERQAQKARQYKKHKDELLDKEMTWGRRKAQVLRGRLESLNRERESMEQLLAGLRAELQVTENQIETDRIEQVTETKDAEELQARIQRHSDELTREQSALELSRRRQGDLTSQLESMQSEKAELEESVESERGRLAVRDDEAEQAEQAYHAIASKAQALDEQVREFRQKTETLRRQVESVKKEMMADIAQSSDLTSQAASFASRIEIAQEQAERLVQQLSAQEQKVAAAREELDRAQQIAEELKAKREELQIDKRERNSRIQAQESQLRDAERSLQTEMRTLTQLKSRLQSLEELITAHEGFGDGPKAALDWAKSSGKSSDLKPLADGFDVAKGFEGAMEGWLESRLENLVSFNVNSSIGALQAIASAKKGRAAIHVSAPSSNTAPALSANDVKALLEASGFAAVGELTRYVQPNDKLGTSAHQALQGLLSSAFVVENFEPVADFIVSGGMERLGGWSIVSRDGWALDSTGILRGGSSAGEGSATLLGRKRAIAELEEQVNAADTKFQESEAKVDELKNSLEEARAAAQLLNSELQELDVRIAGTDRDIHQMNRAVRDAENQLGQIERQKEQAEKDVQTARSNRARIDDRMSEISSRRSELENRIAEGDRSFASQEEELRLNEGELNSVRVEEASLRERAQSLKREHQASQSLLMDRERRLAELTKLLERASREREQFTGGDSELAERIASLTQTLAQAREELAQVKDRLERKNAKLNENLERIKELHKTGDQKNADSNGLALEYEKLNGELTHLVQNLEEKYGQGCLDRPVTSPIQEEMTDPVITLEMSAEEEQLLSEEVERLRERIRRLGEVNTGAIEEFEESKKRYDYLLTERSDLNHSIKNLEEAIEHINKTSETRFKKAFEAIASRFERLFPIIFGGGQARLSLVYPEGSTDILDAGVDILAQPPGKKVVNITLLSGGEKALTAVSLIFAIFMVKPSPFCILDEVDAPLDDANIGKFNALLREMSARSQFILITHNKKTMELNDTLYGVTMEEPGVSKMVSIQMQ